MTSYHLKVRDFEDTFWYPLKNDTLHFTITIHHIIDFGGDWYRYSNSYTTNICSLDLLVNVLSIGSFTGTISRKRLEKLI